jgi:hypothetical protein
VDVCESGDGFGTRLLGARCVVDTLGEQETNGGGPAMGEDDAKDENENDDS